MRARRDARSVLIVQTPCVRATRAVSAGTGSAMFPRQVDQRIQSYIPYSIAAGRIEGWTLQRDGKCEVLCTTNGQTPRVAGAGRLKFVAARRTLRPGSRRFFCVSQRGTREPSECRFRGCADEPALHEREPSKRGPCWAVNDSGGTLSMTFTTVGPPRR